MTSVKKACVIGLSIVGAIVGVGFSSGREISTFFLSHGKLSILFCVLAGVLFSLFSYLVFVMSDKKRIFTSYKVKNGLQNDNFRLINGFEGVYGTILLICQLSICAAMFAGLGEAIGYIYPDFKMDFLIRLGALVFVILLLCFSKSGVYVLNFILSILMLFAVCVMVISLCFKEPAHEPAIKLFDSGLLYMPLLYVGMNIFTAEPLLVEVGDSLKTKKEKILSSVFIGFFITLALIISLLGLMFFGEKAQNMPMFALAEKIGRWFVVVYGVLIILCILTTLISTGYGAYKILGKVVVKKAAIIICLTIAFLISFVGFSKIIDIIYPFIGGLCLVCIVIKYFIYNKCLK